MEKCNHTNIETDYSTAISCCIDCGLVIEQNSSSFFTHEDPNYHPSINPNNTFSPIDDAKYLWPLKRFSTQLASYFNIPLHIQSEINQNILDAHSKGIINLGRKGRIFVGAALFIKCRQYKIPLTLSEISLVMDEDSYNLKNCIFFINHHYHDYGHDPSILQSDPIIFVERYINLLNINDNDNDNGNNNSSDSAIATIMNPKIIRIATELLDLCLKDSWIGEGRRVAPISLAIILIILDRTSISQIKEASLKCHLSEKTVYNRILEITSLLRTKMEQILPWTISSNHQLSLSIPDLIKYCKLERGTIITNTTTIDNNNKEEQKDNDNKKFVPSISLMPLSFIKSEEQRQRRQIQILVAKQRLSLDLTDENVDLEIVQIEKLLLNHISEDLILETRNLFTLIN